MRTSISSTRESLRDFIDREAGRLGFDCVAVASPDAIPLAAERLAAFVAAGHHGSMRWLSGHRATARQPACVVARGPLDRHARRQLRAGQRSARHPRQQEPRRDLGLCAEPRLPRRRQGQAQAAGRQVRRPQRRRRQGVRRHRAGDGKAAGRSRRARLAGQAHQSGQPRIRLLAVPRQHLHHRRARAGQRQRTIVAAPARPVSTSARHQPFPRPTGSMRGAASPTSPSRTRGRSRSNSARRSATASMAATTALRSARGTSSRRPHPRRSSPPATICVRRRWPTCSALDDAGFRALFSGSPVKRIGRDRFFRNVLIAAGNSGDAALVAALPPAACRPVAAGQGRGGVGAVAAAGWARVRRAGGDACGGGDGRTMS